MYKAKKYELDVSEDVLGNVIHKGETYIIDYLKENVVHCEVLYEYFEKEYGDLYILMIEEDFQLYEYVVNTYDCGVYKK